MHEEKTPNALNNAADTASERTSLPVKLTSFLFRLLLGTALALLLLFFLPPTPATAQTTPPQEELVNSTNSILHGRTKKVADVILSKLPGGITRYEEVTELNQLHLIQELRLQNRNLTSLSASVFSKLGSSTEIYLYHNRLTSLPANDFGTLQNLTTLQIWNNQLTNLPAGIFDGLKNLKFFVASLQQTEPLAVWDI